VSIETQAPNPLSTLIHIYSDDESLEPARGSPVRVQEEEGPEKTSSPEPEVQDKEVSQKETGAEGGLDTRESDEQETEAGPSDEPPQKEIDSSTADEQVSNESIPDTSILPNIQIPDERQVEVGSTRQSEEVREPTLEQIYTAGSLGNNLTWGDQQIPEPVDEVADIYAISYDQKRKAIIQRTAKKRRITLDHSILVTTEENLINTTEARTSELIGMGKSLSDATQDRARRDEKELAATLKELEHLHHLAEYYKSAMQTVVYLKGEFNGVYNEFKKERHLLTANIVEFQEDTLMALATCKEMERWHEKAQQVVERLEYIEAVQQGREQERHGIRLVGKSSLDRMKRSVEYWAKMSRDPHREIQEQWAKCQKHWGKINKVMKDVGLPEFGHPR
jgi:hypothetical protein